MTHSLRSHTGHGDGSLLMVAEILHRNRNEYARVISFASLVEAKACNQETKEALQEVIEYLHRSADTQRVLCPPIGEGVGEFTEYLTRLCSAITASLEMERRGITLLLTVEEPIWLDVRRSWRAGLIIFELASNALRHAFDGRPGHVSVAVATESGRIVCRVSDDGNAASTFGSSLGTHLVDALAVQLDGFVERRFNHRGSVATVSFPKDRQVDDGRSAKGKRWSDGAEYT